MDYLEAAGLCSFVVILSIFLWIIKSPRVAVGNFYFLGIGGKLYPISIIYIIDLLWVLEGFN
jgi:hypothetical protein